MRPTPTISSALMLMLIGLNASAQVQVAVTLNPDPPYTPLQGFFATLAATWNPNTDTPARRLFGLDVG